MGDVTKLRERALQVASSVMYTRNDRALAIDDLIEAVRAEERAPVYEYAVMATEVSGDDRLLTEPTSDIEYAEGTAAFFRANRPRVRNIRVVRRVVAEWEEER